MPIQITESVRRFLAHPNVAVLATQSRSGGLQATPVWFEYVDGHVLVNTSRGRVKLQNVQARPDVALAIVDRENPYRYVQIRGRVAAVDPSSGARDIDRLSQRYLGRPYAYPAGDRPEWRVTIRIAPTRVTQMGL